MGFFFEGQVRFLKNIIALLNPNDPKPTIKIAYYAAIEKGLTHDEALAHSVGYWFNFGGKIIEDDELVALLKKVGCYTIDQASELVDMIEKTQRKTRRGDLYQVFIYNVMKSTTIEEISALLREVKHSN